MPRRKKPIAKINTKLPTKKSILDFLSKKGGCCDKVEIVKQFGLSERKDRKECEKKISSLENKGLIQKFTTDLTNEGYFYQYLYYFQKGDVPDV